jgi:excisionase family DNA binding protein
MQAHTTALNVPRLALSLTEVAEALGVSKGLIEKRVKRGEIGTTKIGRRRVVPMRELEKLLANAS